jgi:hypothetical protein
MNKRLLSLMIGCAALAFSAGVGLAGERDRDRDGGRGGVRGDWSGRFQRDSGDHGRWDRRDDGWNRHRPVYRPLPWHAWQTFPQHDRHWAAPPCRPAPVVVRRTVLRLPGLFLLIR